MATTFVRSLSPISAAHVLEDALTNQASLIVRLADGRESVTVTGLSRRTRRQVKAQREMHFRDDPVTVPGTSPASTSVDRLIRLSELLLILGISRSTAYAWQASGRLPHSVALGPRSVAWRLSDIERFLASLSDGGRDDEE